MAKQDVILLEFDAQLFINVYYKIFISCSFKARN